jgi:two-component system NtrC family sensor kinase
MAALTSGIAHELATPLGVIAGRAEQILAHAGDDRSAKHAQLILDQVADIDRVMRGLLNLASGAPIALQPVAPRTLVREAAALVEHRFTRAHVALHPDVGEVPDVRCEPQLLKHALVNLLLNACDAAKGEVRVDVSADAA